MRILLTGGGTLGPVTPLLALATELKKENASIVGFIGTRGGPEKNLVEKSGIKFFAIASGKLRRYFDLRTIFVPFFILIGFVQSLFLLTKLKPTIVVSASGYVGVPVLIAAWILRIPSITHQQDVRPSLANQLAKTFVKKITVTFEASLNFFGKKAVHTGNPIRTELLSGNASRARAEFGLEENIPTVLVLGGGTGSVFINDLVEKSLSELTLFCQIIHSTGKGKMKPWNMNRYHAVELLTDNLADAYAVADLLIARAGMATISELSVLSKPAIIIPLIGTHQEDNAKLLGDRNAAVVLSQNELTVTEFVKKIKELLDDPAWCSRLSLEIKKINPSDALVRMMKVVKEI